MLPYMAASACAIISSGTAAAAVESLLEFEDMLEDQARVKIGEVAPSMRRII